MSFEIHRNGFSILEFQVQQQASSTASLTAFNLTNLTANFVVNTTLGIVHPVIEKSSTAVTEIVVDTTGKCQVYIQDEDTINLTPGNYYYTLYATDSIGRTYNIDTDKIKLRDSVLPD